MQKASTHQSFRDILDLLEKQDPEEKIRIAFNLWQFVRDLQDRKVDYGQNRTNTPRTAA